MSAPVGSNARWTQLTDKSGRFGKCEAYAWYKQRLILMNGQKLVSFGAEIDENFSLTPALIGDGIQQTAKINRQSRLFKRRLGGVQVSRDLNTV